MSVSNVGGIDPNTGKASQTTADQPAQNAAAKVKVSEKTKTNSDGTATVTVTYSDGSTSTYTEPGDTVSISSSGSK